MNLIATTVSSLRHRGLAGSARKAIELAVESAAGRWYDRTHRVETSGQVSSLCASGRGYRGTMPGFLRRRIRELRIPCPEYSFIDIGSGKGRTLLVAAEFPFRGIVGVEYSESLHRRAVANCAAAGLLDRIECLLLDAREYRFPDGPLLIYMFSPFREEVLQPVVAQLAAAWARQPRPIRIVYRKPIWTAALDRAPFLVRCKTSLNRIMPDYGFTVYRESPSLRHWKDPS